jgi:hypothetical protein
MRHHDMRGSGFGPGVGLSSVADPHDGGHAGVCKWDPRICLPGTWVDKRHSAALCPKIIDGSLGLALI